MTFRACPTTRVGLITVGLALGLCSCSRPRGHEHPSPLRDVQSARAAPNSARPSAPTMETDRDIPPRVPEGPLRYLLIGGGATPESTEVSLEQDITLVQRTLSGPGRVLFAGGKDSLS